MMYNQESGKLDLQGLGQDQDWDRDHYSRGLHISGYNTDGF